MKVGIFLSYIGLGSNIMHLAYCHEIAKKTNINIGNVGYTILGNKTDFLLSNYSFIITNSIN